MIWWLPWLGGTVAWPLAYLVLSGMFKIAPDPAATAASGAALIVLAVAMIQIALR